MMELKLADTSSSAFDTENTFNVDVGKRFFAKCSLHYCEFDEKNIAKFWGLQHCVMISDSYSSKEIAEQARLAKETPVKHGDVVFISGEKYTARVLGDYSDAVVFDPIV